jgi:hypothetical protein
VPTGEEGPPGSAACSDGDDNECDGTTDSADQSCITYTNDFSSDTSDFEYGSSDWSMSSDKVRVSGCSFSATGAYLDNASWTDVLVTASVHFDGSCGGTGALGVTLRAGGTPVCGAGASGYVCQLENSGSGLSILRMDPAACANFLTTDAAATLLDDTTYNLEFRAVGSTLTCTASGGSLTDPITVTTTDSTYASGTVGFGSFNDSSEFDNLTATSL